MLPFLPPTVSGLVQSDLAMFNERHNDDIDQACSSPYNHYSSSVDG